MFESKNVLQKLQLEKYIDNTNIHLHNYNTFVYRNKISHIFIQMFYMC